MKGVALIKKIEEIRKSLDLECFLSALSLALTIPDICGKIEYPGKRGRKVYIDWFNKYVYKDYYKYDGKSFSDKNNFEFDGIVCYALRCSFLHAGNLDFTDEKVFKKAYNDNDEDIYKFELCLSNKKDNGAYVDHYGKVECNWKEKNEYSVRLDVRRLCRVICESAEEYYDKSEDKEAFSDSKIVINVIGK